MMVETITREELKAKMDRGDEFVLLETTQHKASFRRARLPGAIMFDKVSKAPEVLPDKDAYIVTYCLSFG